MLQSVITGLLWFSAIGCGLLAGLYFAFSTFIMTALGRIGQVSGITAMNAINAVIVQSLFMPLFLGTTLASLLLAVAGLLRWGEPGAAAMLAGGVLHVIGNKSPVWLMAFAGTNQRSGPSRIWRRQPHRHPGRTPTPKLPSIRSLPIRRPERLER